MKREKKNEWIKKEKRWSGVGPGPTWRIDRAHPGVSASPHILPIFEMDMRVRGHPGHIGKIWGVRLGHFFPSLSCPVTDRARPRAYERWFEASGCGCRCSEQAKWLVNHRLHDKEIQGASIWAAYSDISSLSRACLFWAVCWAVAPAWALFSLCILGPVCTLAFLFHTSVCRLRLL